MSWNWLKTGFIWFLSNVDFNFQQTNFFAHLRSISPTFFVRVFCMKVTFWQLFLVTCMLKILLDLKCLIICFFKFRHQKPNLLSCSLHYLNIENKKKSKKRPLVGFLFFVFNLNVFLIQCLTIKKILNSCYDTSFFDNQ